MNEEQTDITIGRFNKIIAYFGGRKYTMAMIIVILVNWQLYEKRIDTTEYVTIIVACLGIFSYANVAQKKIVDNKTTTS